jgi:CheY-like chemotaxis protein
MITRLTIEKSYFAAEVLVMNSGKDALKHLTSTEENQLPDFIFLDLRMPVMSGQEFIEAFSQLPLHVKQSTKVVLLSSSEKEPSSLLNMGYPFLLTSFIKPVTEEQLRQL